MKKLFLSCSILLIIASCSNPRGAKDDASANDTSEGHIDSIQAPAKKAHKKKKNELNNGDSTYCYEPSISTLTGTLKEEEFFGPPGYGANPNTDSKEKQYILYLDQPINVKPSKKNAEELETKTKVDKITLVIDKKSSSFKHNIGKEIVVKGKLFPAETGHHHTPVLMGEAELVK
ncbi:MAG: DUF4431 domain-containing protein [Bacteroidota bacterium]